MKIWKRIMIVALCVLAVAALTFVGLLCQAYYDKYHKEYYWENLSRMVSPNILMEYGEKGSEEFVRLKDIRTGKYTTPKLQHIFINDYSVEDSLVVFRTHDRLRGYLNVNNGKIVIPAQYNRAWNFSEGVAAVLKDGVVSFVNSSGEPAMTTTFPIFYYDDYSEIAFQFHDGQCVMRTPDNKWGLINKNGEWTIQPIYASIDSPRFGYRVVTDGRKYGLLADDGTLALPLEYDIIRVASDKRGFFIAKDGYAKEVDKSLHTIIPFVYDGLYMLEYVREYRDNEEPVYWRYDIDVYSGVMDMKGNVIIPAKYYMIRLVDDNLFEAEVTCGGDRILINNKGEFVGKSNF